MSNVKYILLALCIYLAAISCVAEVHVANTVHEEKVEVRFIIRTSASLPHVSRASDNPLENNINDLAIIVMKSDGGEDFVGDYIVIVEDFEPATSSTVAFKASLFATETKVKLLFIANCPADVKEYLELHATDFGQLKITEAELRATLTSPAEAITMTGEATLDAIHPETVTIITVPLIRSLAKVDMLLKLPPGSLSFEPQVGFIYHSNELLQIFPNLETLDDPLTPSMVLAPSVPGNSEIQHYGNYVYPTDPETGAFFTAYVSESVEAKTIEERLAATCIVVGGSFDGGPTTYYRVDFNSDEDGHPFGQILRNHYYVFTITGISAPGQGNINDALEKASIAIVVDGAWERVVPLGLYN